MGLFSKSAAPAEAPGDRIDYRTLVWRHLRPRKLEALTQRRDYLRGLDAGDDRLAFVEAQIRYWEAESPPSGWQPPQQDAVVSEPPPPPPGQRRRRLRPDEPYPPGYGVAAGTKVGNAVVYVDDDE